MTERLQTHIFGGQAGCSTITDTSLPANSFGGQSNWRVKPHIFFRRQNPLPAKTVGGQ